MKTSTERKISRSLYDIVRGFEGVLEPLPFRMVKLASAK